MEHYLNEKTVMRFYLDQMDADEISFLKGRDEIKASIRTAIEALIEEDKMNKKIQIAIGLWKNLFQASMSYISSNKNGYDKIFDYFDSYVEFEELIFASDSFYRDHTLHCLWVYFLGEYIKRNEEFAQIFDTAETMNNSIMELAHFCKDYNLFSREDQRDLENTVQSVKKLTFLYESVRCLAALTHDLGYPLKKIEKINKSMKKVLPYYGIHNFNDFAFEYGNIQQSFVDRFIDFISRRLGVAFDGVEDYQEILMKLMEFDEEGNLIRYKDEEKDVLTKEERDSLKCAMKLEESFTLSNKLLALYSNDFENYQHGIMSAFLLMKNLQAFQEVEYNAVSDKLARNYRSRGMALHTILSSITNHTCDGYQISMVDDDSFLTFVDELEEFSRISRASQNREYVEEFCDSAIYMEDGWFNVVFEFNNTTLDNLDPERAFKGRCKRFLSLFDIEHLDKQLRIRVKVVGKLPTDQSEYVLEIANRYAKITVDGEEKSIPKYLKSIQYLTREEYAAL